MAWQVIVKVRGRLVEGWQDAWKFLSVQGAAFGLVLIGAWNALDEKLQDALPVWLLSVIAVLVLLGIILGRIIQQPSVTATATIVEKKDDHV
jgi:hypothetical protein